jgi:hypothetical protein
MRIVRAGGSPIATTTRHGATETIEPDAPEAETRALIALEPAAPVEHSPRLTGRSDAPFIAQLIATRMQVPQLRARRRAEPGEAIAAYRRVYSAKAG